MNKAATLRIKRTLIALALGVALLTVVPAISSLLVISSALSDRSDVPPQRRGGVTVVEKNGETPAWMAELLDRASPSVETDLTDHHAPDDGLAI